MTSPSAAGPDRQGDTAGFITRGIAFTLDTVIVAVSFNLTLAGTVFILSLLFDRDISNITISPLALTLMFLTWSITYGWIGLAVFGRTLGKGLMGLKVLRRDGGRLGVFHSLLRVVVAPLMQTVTVGIDVLWILVSPRRLALHDIVLRTKVVYAWAAYAAKPLVTIGVRGRGPSSPPAGA